MSGPLVDDIPPAATRRERLLDRTAAVGLLALVTWVQGGNIFRRLEGVDWVAYALPAANLLKRGVFATPQLGEQCGFDLYWLWNSPLMGLGPLPFFLLFGVSRTSYLIGCWLGAVVTSIGVSRMIARAPGVGSWTLGVVAAYALLGTRSFSGELVNQRYTPIAVLAIAFLFLPGVAGQRRPGGGRWLLAGALPLLHPALVLASAVWVFAELLRGVHRWRHGEVSLMSARHLTLFAIGFLACALWYLRPIPLTTQFLPQARESFGRSGWIVYAPPLLRDVSLATYVTVIVLIILASVRAICHPREDERFGRVGVLLSLVLALDLLRGFFYLPYYLLGLAPPALFALRAGLIRRCVVPVLAGLSLLHAGVAWKLDPFRLLLTNHQASLDYIVSQTQPGDRIVLGPPFVLPAAEPHWPGGRQVRYVVPMPYFLKSFELPRFLATIHTGSDIYVGEERSYYHADARHYFKLEANTVESGSPLFSSAVVRRDQFLGQQIVIARVVLSEHLPSSVPTRASGRRDALLSPSKD